MKKIWGGRFEEEADRRVIEFTGSFHFDVRLLPYDIRGSAAHARMLRKTGLLSDEECKTIIEGLEEILKEFNIAGSPEAEAEDVHSYVEIRLRDKIGELAGKLHTARSRNDQVALDIKLYLLDVSSRIISSINNLMTTLIHRAEENLDVVMPGFTHLQPAQPVLLSHHLMAYFEMLHRDRKRFEDARRRADEMPLGAGALAGTSIPIDRSSVADELGFSTISRNSLDTVSDRDFLLEFGAAAAITMVHLSRFGEELVLWTNPAFGFVELPDSLATGSSMMPQKKNPDVAELVRGKSGRVFGHLVSLLTVMKGLPLAYQRDLQEDKEAVFDIADTLSASLEIISVFTAGIVFKRERMASASRLDHTGATDLAEYLVIKGMPFRQAHEVVGGIVREAVSQGKNIDDLSTADLRSHSKLFEEDVLEIMSPMGSVKNKKSAGSTKPELVAEAIRKAKESLLSGGGSV